MKIRKIKKDSIPEAEKNGVPKKKKARRLSAEQEMGLTVEEWILERRHNRLEELRQAMEHVSAGAEKMGFGN